MKKKINSIKKQNLLRLHSLEKISLFPLLSLKKLIHGSKSKDILKFSPKIKIKCLKRCWGTKFYQIYKKVDIEKIEGKRDIGVVATFSRKSDGIWLGPYVNLPLILATASAAATTNTSSGLLALVVVLLLLLQIHSGFKHEKLMQYQNVTYYILYIFSKSLELLFHTLWQTVSNLGPA